MNPPTSGQQIERIEKGQRKLSQEWIDRAAAAFGVAPEKIITPLDGPTRAAPVRDEIVNQIEMVGIQHIDQAYGMGAVFTETHVEVDVLQFPKLWVETITYSPPSLLTWMRGRGDSMFPTICDGDLVLVDRSQRDVKEQDAIWAFTVGDVGSIKRLRVKGDRYIILSDNGSVPPDEEPIDFVRVVGRVAFVGSKK